MSKNGGVGLVEDGDEVVDGLLRLGLVGLGRPSLMPWPAGADYEVQRFERERGKLRHWLGQYRLGWFVGHLRKAVL
ncbi:hypothetical protein [Polymorphospora rubra]|nr:hypothetical protein [Polymorphospora rubra]